MNTHPVNLWINFVLNAVLGRLAEADEMMRRFRPAIRSVAVALCARHPFPRKPLHRGILVEGAFDPATREFVSWSEDADVAEWFADPRSMMNEYVMEHRPSSVGYLLTSTGRERVLFHYSWARLQDLPALARMHPEMGVEGARQMAWSLQTQREVITEPPREWPPLRPFAPERGHLDDRFAPPWISRGGASW